MLRRTLPNQTQVTEALDAEKQLTQMLQVCAAHTHISDKNSVLASTHPTCLGLIMLTFLFCNLQEQLNQRDARLMELIEQLEQKVEKKEKKEKKRKERKN